MIVLFNDSPNPPIRSLGVYRIATELRRHGIEVEIIDFLSHWDQSVLLTYLDTITEVEWWGFSTKFFPPTYNSDKFAGQATWRNNNWTTNNHGAGFMTELSSSDEELLIDYIKNRQGTIVVGGPNAEIIQHMPINIDIICAGYSDLAVVAVHNHIVQGNDLIYTHFNNKKYVDADKHYAVQILNNLTTEYADSDFVTDDWVLPIEIGRGCIFQCAFCEFDHLGKKPGTYIRSKEEIKQDVLYRYNTFGVKKFMFVDDTFNDSLEKMYLIRDIRQETGIDFEFWSYCRIDLLAANPEQVNLIPEIGWKSFTIGIETFNRNSGKAVGKGADPEKLKHFLIALKDRFPELRLQVNIIVGLPHDTEDSIRETAEWFLANPDVAEYVKFATLRIKNPEGLTKNISKMSKDPEKYGYKILDGKQFDVFKWTTPYLDTGTAQQLVEKYNPLLWQGTNNRRPDHVTTLSDQPYFATDRFYVIKNYISKKLHYRNV